MVQYWYDAWGNHKVCDVSGNEITDMTHIGHMNAYRYRGYYYDRETGLYYLNTRYYDPQTGRFINRDSVAYADASFLNGLNLYAYCNNNPVMYVDPNGQFPWLLAGLLVVELVVSLVVLNGSSDDGRVENYEDEVTEPYEEVPLSTGTVVYFAWIGQQEGVHVFNSFKLTSKERWEFLRYLQNKNPNINVKRMNNEWVWHNLAYKFGIKRESTTSVDVLFSGNDTGHGFFSWVMNNFQIFQAW